MVPFKIFIFILLVLPLSIQAQTVLRGVVYKADDETKLTGVSIVNVTTKAAAVSRLDGSYTISAKEGDIVTFFSLGHQTDTVTVEFELLRSGYDAYLVDNMKTLSTVTVTSDYSRDSLERREEYANIYNRQTKVTGGNTPEAGVGIVLSPVSYFSKDGREARRLKKRLKKQEEDYYIDHVFSEGWVSSLTGLKGDSLKLFMYMYRPSYKFARESDRSTLLLYVNDKYKEFTDPKNRTRR